VRGVAHAVDSLHLQLLDQTAAQVAELVKAVPTVVTAHAAVTWAKHGRSSQLQMCVGFVLPKKTGGECRLV